MNHQEIMDDIESILISHCDMASSNRYSVVDGFNVAADEILKKYRNDLTPNQIVYCIRKIVSDHMFNPASTIFDYVCITGINTKFITSNVPIISKDDYIDFCMSNAYYECDSKYDTISQHGIAIMSYFLEHVKNGHVSNMLLSDSVSKRNIMFLRLENVFNTMQKLFHIVRETSDFKYMNCNELYNTAESMKSSYFKQNENMHIFHNMDSHWAIDTIFDFIRKAISGDYISFTDENDLTVLCDVIGLNIHKDLDQNGTGIYLVDVFTIINTFILKYIEVVRDMYAYEAQFMPDTYPFDCSAANLTYEIIVCALDAMLIPLDDVISNLEKSTDSNSFYKLREVLYDVYSCIYDNILYYNANRRYLDGV